MFPADLYIDRIRLGRYFTEPQCRNCGANSCEDLVNRLQNGSIRPADLSFLSFNRAAGLRLALEAENILPEVPKLDLPRPAPPGLTEINNPKPGDPVLVTGNSRFTQEVLLAVVSMSLAPMFLLFVDTRGDTLDMAIILDTFTPDRVALSVERVSRRIDGSPLILPGLSAPMEEDISTATGRSIEVGPVCAAELPLMFGDRWIPA